MESSQGVTAETQPQLPPELIDQIIDHLQHDINSLRACSLAGRAILPRARHHKLAHVVIRPHQSFEPSIAGYVRELTLPSEWCRWLASSLSTPDIWPAVLAFRNLQQLSFSGMCITKRMIAALPSHLSFPTVLKLRLVGCDIGNTEALLLIQAFPRLESIHVEGLRWAFGDHHVSKEDFPPLSGELVAKLTSQPPRLFSSAGQLLRLLLSIPSGIRFRSITISCPVYGPWFNQFLQACGTHLQQLEFKFYDRTSMVDLSYNTNLRELTLPRIYSNPAETSPIPFLAEYCSSSLRYLILKCADNGRDARYITPQFEFDWAALESVLINGQLPNLHCVRVFCSRPETVSRIHMPMLRSRGMLEVIVSSS